MKNLYITFLLGFLSSASDIPNYLKADFEEAILFLHDNEDQIDLIAKEFPSNDQSVVLSIVAPELIRFQLFNDFFETKALEWAYVNGGVDAADYSIGRFQMKPSFIELLELEVLSKPELTDQFINLIEYKSDAPKAIRKERVERLKDFNWQLRYSNLYFCLMKNYYFCIDSRDLLSFIHISATAYNLGFNHPIAEIESYGKKQAFPYGNGYETDQLAYGRWSQLFYISLTHPKSN